jgi:predicted glycosyltransferase
MIHKNLTVFFTIRHPARVHLFKNLIFELEEMGHDVHTYTVGSGIINDLLDYYDIEHEQLASVHDTLPELIVEQTKVESRLLHRAVKIRPDIMIDGVAAQHVSKVVGATSLSFMDTEHATLTKKITVPFADKIYTPDCYQQDFGEKQTRYPSYHELAYLHPNHFDPDPSVLDEVGLIIDDSFVILRLVAWDAVHDLGETGFEDIEDFVTALEKKGWKSSLLPRIRFPTRSNTVKSRLSPTECTI